jgi:hypothetical protein
MLKRVGFAAAFVVLAEALSSGVALAADNYGAIATSASTNHWGLTYDYPTQEEAESAALAQCKQNADDCEGRIWFKNGCGAVAHGETLFGWAIGDSREEAENGAKSALKEHGDSGNIVAWACTTR